MIFLKHNDEDPQFFDNVITGDKSSFFKYNPETKFQSNKWHTLQPPWQKKTLMSKSRMKTMLIMLFDNKGVVNSKFVSKRQTVNGAFYVEVLKRLEWRINRMWSETGTNWKFHHGNASSHTFVVTEYLTKNGIVTIPHPPYNPNHAKADIFLFLKESHHKTLDPVKTACTHGLRDVSVADFQGTNEAWKTDLQRCIDTKRESTLCRLLEFCSDIPIKFVFINVFPLLKIQSLRLIT